MITDTSTGLDETEMIPSGERWKFVCTSKLQKAGCFVLRIKSTKKVPNAKVEKPRSSALIRRDPVQQRFRRRSCPPPSALRPPFDRRVGRGPSSRSIFMTWPGSNHRLGENI